MGDHEKDPCNAYIIMTKLVLLGNSTALVVHCRKNVLLALCWHIEIKHG